MNRRSLLVAAAVGSALVVAVVFARPAGQGGPPLDPHSTAADGTRALVELVEGLGSRVEVVTGVPGTGVDVLLVLRDRYDETDRAAVERWVRGGGRLVTADAGSSLALALPAGAHDGALARGCELEALRGAGEVDGAVVLLAARAGATACYTEGGSEAGDGGAWLVTAAVGSGAVVQLGGPGPFVNARLGDADNAVVAAGLLAPSPGVQVAVLDPNLPGASGAEARSLRDLLASGVKAALLQLLVAFVVVGMWRARRLGAPVEEPAPVSVPPAAIVPAVAALQQRARSRSRPTRRLRAGVRRRLSHRLGLPVDAPDAALASVTAERLGLDPVTVAATLAGPDPGTDDELLALARSVHDVTSALDHPTRRSDAHSS